MFRNRTVLLMELDKDEIRVLYRPLTFLKKTRAISVTETPSVIKLMASINPGDPNKEIVVNGLKDYRINHLGRAKARVFLLLPFSNGLIRIVKFPWIARKYRDKAIGYRIEQEIPLPTGQLVYRYLIVEEKRNEYLSVALIGIRKDTLSYFTDCFQQAGYNLQGAEYAITAFGKTLEHLDNKSILSLREENNSSVQAVLYIKGLPSAVRMLPTNEQSVLNYEIYLILRDCQVPLDLVITDGSDQAEMIAVQLGKAGFSQKSDKHDYYREQFALTNGMLRIENKENINFCLSAFRAAKIRALSLICGIFLIVMILLGCSAFSLIMAQEENEREIAVLQNIITTQKEKQDEQQWIEWLNSNEKSLSDCRQVRASLDEINNDIILTRVAYQQGTLLVWAHCSDNAKIITAMNGLTANGWGKPQLNEYHCEAGQIDFCLGVQR